VKRPKIADMTPLELVRCRLLQVRRTSRRHLKVLGRVWEELPPQTQAECEVHRAALESYLAVTKPSWVRSAPLNELMAALHHIEGKSN
jgi:hypothetical protein